MPLDTGETRSFQPSGGSYKMTGAGESLPESRGLRLYALYFIYLYTYILSQNVYIYIYIYCECKHSVLWLRIREKSVGLASCTLETGGIPLFHPPGTLGTSKH